MSMNVWELAARLLAHTFTTGQKLDLLLETVPAETAAVERRRCRHLVYGAVRHRALLEFAVNAHLRRPPRPLLRAILILAAFELFDEPGATPVIVHHAVRQARALTSETEARLVNAVLRRVPAALRSVLDSAADDAASLALRFSHPPWLVERWIARWGAGTIKKLLEWNQQPAPVHARVTGTPDQARLEVMGVSKVAGQVPLPVVRPANSPAHVPQRAEEPARPPTTSNCTPPAPRERAAVSEAVAPNPRFFVPTRWPGFFRLDRADWSEVERLLAIGAIYLQDPATAIAPGLLAPAEGETLLDNCAAPGGKTLQLAARAGPTGHVVAVDASAPRLERLRENLARHPAFRVNVLHADAAELTPATLAAAGLPESYDGVLVDVPCSNTGVLRHRVDAKWRLRPDDLARLPARQLAILRRSAALVRPGGRLVYSTCSLEPEENEAVVEAFLAENDAFVLERTESSRPWESGCDGAAAFLLRHVAAT